MRKIYMIFALLIVASTFKAAQNDKVLNSPDGRIEVTVSIGEDLTYTVVRDGKTLLLPSALSMNLSSGEVWGQNARLVSCKTIEVNQVIPSPFYKKQEVKDEYNGLQMVFRGAMGIGIPCL